MPLHAPSRPPAARVPAMAAVATALTLLVTGCGAHGQPDALEACKAYTNATSGVVSAAARDAGLRDAEHWAGKAVDKAAKWQPLLDALRSYRGAVTGAGATGGPGLTAAKATIQTTCETAARGY